MGLEGKFPLEECREVFALEATLVIRGASLLFPEEDMVLRIDERWSERGAASRLWRHDGSPVEAR